MATAQLIPRPAATLIVLRDGERGFEVLMLRRPASMVFAGNAFVFPGGSVDEADSDSEVADLTVGLDDKAASAKLGLAHGGLAYWITAIRECFEEAGLLYAAHESGELVHVPFRDVVAQRAAMASVARNDAAFAQVVRESRGRIAADRLEYFSRWITQAGRPRRFDTRFFVALAPEHQTAIHNEAEADEHIWIDPREALERNGRGEFNLLFPTLKTLEALARFKRANEVLEFARQPRPVEPMEPRTALAREGPRILVPGDYAYAEVGKLDPANRGDASCEIVPGVVVTLSDRVRRITAANPGMMTGPGTNTYLVGDASSGIAVIDPGPLIPDHLDRIVAAAGGPIRWILATHTHIDHSPGVAVLKARTGATTIGMVARHPERQDETFAPDHAVNDGDRLSIAGCSLRVIHTPGHASNQLCYLLEEERLLFTGDHIMQGSTVVINPPDGDMSEYFASLTRLYDEDLAWLAPGHGFLMDRPHERVERLLVHRRARENKIVIALRKAGAATIEQLVPPVYDDTPVQRHEIAARSLLAHLLKLETEGRAVRDGERWRAVLG
jgi:glyoxylase-like metal-dependent hydrolase (beta-lactamase superfamily II)/8-oxo-dGTP pyrophosphatase MutT (NUDIX family)